MTGIRHIKYLTAVVSIICLAAANSWAQNPNKVDMPKTGGKFADWVQKQRENYQDNMEKISESQFGQALGDGISAAKDAKKFVGENIATVKQEVNKIQNSTEYKAGMLAKQIALKEQELEKLKKERDQKISALKEDIEIQRTVEEEKARQEQENREIEDEILSPDEPDEGEATPGDNEPTEEGELK